MSTRKRSQPDTPTRTPANADTAAVARHQPGRLQTGTQLGVVSPEVTQLRFLGFTTCQVPQKTMEALEYACNTYQLQLNKCSKQHPQNKFPWYTESQRKQQLEMRIGSEVHNNQEVLRDCTRVVGYLL